MKSISYEQKARDMLERCGWCDAQQCTAGDVVEVANLLVERDNLKNKVLKNLKMKTNSLGIEIE